MSALNAEQNMESLRYRIGFRLWSLRQWLKHTLPTKLGSWIARRLPRWIIGHCFIRVVAETTTGQWSTTVSSLTCMDAISRWGELER